jgi:hypothetical protein
MQLLSRYICGLYIGLHLTDILHLFRMKIKIAYEKLMDADQRKTIIYHIERITEESAKDRRKALSKGVSLL